MKFKLLLIAFILHFTVFGQTITLALNNVPGPQTLTLENTSQVLLTELAISSCEGSINEIRIYQNTSSVNNELSGVKKLIKTIDQLGREVNHTTNQILFHIYNDGSVEKKFIVE